MPHVTVLLPTYKDAPHLTRSIQSVMSQSYTDWELLVVDDGLSHTALDLVKSFIEKDKRISLLSNPQNLGIQKSLNKGLLASRGKYIARIDDDDEWVDVHKLKDQIAFIENNPECVLVGTGAVIVDESGLEVFRYLLPESDADIRKKILYKNCFIHSSVVFNRETALRVGGYSESKDTLHVEDYDLWLRMGMEGHMHNMQTYGIFFTLSRNSISSQNKKTQLFRNVGLVSKYKNAYPYATINILRAQAKAYMYGLYCLLPKSLRLMIFKFYKKML